MHLTIHTLESAPDEAKDLLKAAHDRFGFLPNLLGELAGSPPALEAYLTLGRLLEETSLTRQEQQVVLAAASVANNCKYCVAAHTAGLKAAGLAEDQIEALRSGRALADPSLEAVRSLTAAVVGSRGWVGETELRSFLDAGHTKEQVLEVLLGVAMKTLSNYTNHVAHTPLDAALEAFAWEAVRA
ncbi:MAG: carboxymuconolactone decarboxylase family protein [Acidobacteria bacterium]|nr:carboxymuconolactone decarboxylase family protein [Acidobacteriota bacterium]